MKLVKPTKKNHGKPSGAVRVLITEGLTGIGYRGHSECFIVYETSPKELKEYFIKNLGGTKK